MVFKRRTRRSFRQVLVESVYPRGGWFRALWYILYRLRRLPDQPHRIARGIACGIFVSFTPFFGFHLFIAAGLAWLIGGNVVASLLATLVGNPLTFPLIMALAMELGRKMLHQPGHLNIPKVADSFVHASVQLAHNAEALVTGGVTHWDYLAQFLDRIFLPYLVGGLGPGLIAALAGYYLSLPLIGAYQKRRVKKLRERTEKLRAQKAAGQRPAGQKAATRAGTPDDRKPRGRATGAAPRPGSAGRDEG